MKHVRGFNTLQEAKASTLYSPVITQVTEGENSKILMLSVGIDDAKCKITGNTLDDVKVVLDDPKYQYLTIEPMAEGTTFYLFKRTSPTITKTVDLKYSLDEGKTWTQYTMPAPGQNGASISIPMGSKLLLKGNNETGGFNDCYTVGNTTNNKQVYYILGSGQQYVHGNLLSLVYGDDFIGKTSYPNDGCFGRLFQTNAAIKKADIYVTTNNNKYTGSSIFMGDNNSILETVKISGNLACDACYSMFYKCLSLKSVDFTECNLNNVTNMGWMFCDAGTTNSIERVKLKSSVLHDCILRSMFCGAKVKHVDFSEFNVYATESSWFFGKRSTGICGMPYVETMDLSGVNSSRSDGTEWGTTEYNGSDIFEYFDNRYTWSSLKSLKYGVGAITTCMTSVYYLSSFCPAITDKHALALNIVQSLGTITTGKTYYLGDDLLNTLSDEEKAIATNKGWTLQGGAPALTSALPPMTTAAAPNVVEYDDIECPAI